MGKVLSMISRKANRFNVENRAERIISKDKPTPAPKHPSTLKEIDLLMKEHKGAMEELKIKDPQLDEHLKSVYVTSTVIDMTKFCKPSDKDRLPVNRSASVNNELGYDEPEIIPPGRLTLKQVLSVLRDKDAINVNIEKITQALKISEEDAVHLVNYFSAFKVHMPEATPRLGIVDKAKKSILTPITSTKVVSEKATLPPLQLENKTSAKPD